MQSQPGSGAGRWIPVVLILALLAAVGSWVYTSKRAKQHSAEGGPTSTAQPAMDSRANLNTPSPSAVIPSPEAVAPASAPQAQQPAHPPASPVMRALVNRLAIDFSKGAITAEQVAEWKTNLQQLVQAGSGGVSAIREFLQQNKDVPFDPKQGGSLLGAPSLRMALLQALQQIGGPEALALAVDTLHTTSQPLEIAQLARHLEADAPAQYRDAILSAARESLAMGTGGKLGGADVGPLFDVMSRYGGTAALNDLQTAAAHYRYYSALALANIPDGGGIPALSQMLREPGGPNKSTQIPALEALAQLAAFYPEAGARLIEQAKHNQIPDTLWPSIAESIAGRARFYLGSLADLGLTPQSGDRTFHLNAGNQNVLKRQSAVQLTPEQVQQSIGLIDSLLALNPSPVGIESLQKNKTTLSGQGQ